MKEIIVALLAGGVGVALMMWGYRLARLFIPLWGFVSGLSLGAAAYSAMSDTPFLGASIGILVGVGLGILFAAFAYLYYSLAIAILGVSLGYWIGSGFITLLGFNPGLLSTLTGVGLGIMFGVITLLINAPKYVLIAATSIAGAITVIESFLLLTNQVSLETFSYSSAQATVSNSVWWILTAFVIALAGVLFQVRTTTDYNLEEWGIENTPGTTTIPHGTNG